MDNDKFAPLAEQFARETVQKLEEGNVYVGDFGREIIERTIQQAIDLATNIPQPSNSAPQ